MVSLLEDNCEFIKHMAQIDEYNENAVNEVKRKFRDTTIMAIHLSSYIDVEDVLKNGLIPDCFL